MRMAILTGLLALSSTPSAAAGQSCLPFLTAQGGAVSTMQLVTLNRNGVASSARFGVAYQPAFRTPGAVRQARWYADSSTAPVPRQTFSDRFVGAGSATGQAYAVSQAEDLDVTVGVEASPEVTVTLRSHGGTRARFRATCSAGGVLHGSTADVDYLLHLTQNVVR